MRGAFVNLLYNPDAPKKPTNLSLNSDLVQKAKEENINISSIVEQAIADELKMRKEFEWKTENKKSIEDYNEFTTRVGCFSDGLRSV